MRIGRFSESQIVAILKEGEAGLGRGEGGGGALSQARAIRAATGVLRLEEQVRRPAVSRPTHLRELEADNADLKYSNAELALDVAAVKEVIARRR